MGAGVYKQAVQCFYKSNTYNNYKLRLVNSWTCAPLRYFKDFEHLWTIISACLILALRLCLYTLVLQKNHIIIQGPCPPQPYVIVPQPYVIVYHTVFYHDTCKLNFWCQCMKDSGIIHITIRICYKNRTLSTTTHSTYTTTMM